MLSPCVRSTAAVANTPPFSPFAFAAQPELLATVSPDWRMEGYRAVISRFERTDQGRADLRSFLTDQNMLAMNQIMPRGSMVWRNR